MHPTAAIPKQAIYATNIAELKNMIDFYEKTREIIDQLYISEGQNFCQSHFHRHIELLYVLESGLLVTVNKETHLMNAGEVAIMDSFDIHSYPNPKQLKSISLVIPVALCPEYKKRTKQLMLSSHFVTDSKPCSEILCFLRMMQEHTHTFDTPLSLTTRYSPRDEVFIFGCVTAIMGVILRVIPLAKREKNNDDDLTKNLLIYLDNHYNENITLETLAKHFGYSKFYFSKICQKILNSSMTKYLNKLRILKFLEDDRSDATLTELASKHGFSSMRTFQRAFKEYVGITASEYSAQINSKSEL